MKNLFNDAVVTNPEEVKGGTLFLLAWLFGGFYGYGGSKGGHGSYGGSKGGYGGSKSYSKW